jgi:hypothetical protein
MLTIFRQPFLYPRNSDLSASNTIRRRLSVLSLVLISAVTRSGIVAAQEPSAYASIDAYALSIPKSEASSIKNLAKVLAKGANDDRGRARVIYRWVTKNIAYDTKAFFSGDLGDMSPNNVLRTMKGVCDGYALLFASLAQAMGMEAIRIGGNSKGYGYTVGSKFEGPPNHAWNAVKIDGTWRLLDCTWGAGYINDQKKFVERYSDYYFLTPADQFIYDHFPEDPEKQFLPTPVTKDYYENLANLQPPFFAFGLKLRDHVEGTIRSGGRLDISIGAPASVLIMAQVLQQGQALDPMQTYVQRSSDQATVKALFPETGTYILRLFVKQRGDQKPQLEKAAEFQVKVDGSSSESVLFPIVYGAFEDYDLKLSGPVEREIRVERRVNLGMTSPLDILLLASLERDGTRLDPSSTFVRSENGVHTIMAVFAQPGMHTLNVYAKRKSEKGNYNAVLTSRFNCVAMKDLHVGFPTVYDQYREYDAFLFSPMDGQLKSGEPHTYQIRVPRAEDVAVLSNGQWSHLKRSGDVFEGNAVIGMGKAELFARFPGSKQFVALLAFEGVQ